MAGGSRSPFGSVLRSYRQKRGLSQSALADRIAERGLSNPALASLGMVSDKAIANLERPRASASDFVRPRPQTVKILASALDLPPGSEKERAFFAAAEETRSRIAVRRARKSPHKRPLFVRDGREDQLERLNQAWRRARNGVPQFVLLAGDAGAGKTHMLREFCMDIQPESPQTRIAWGECSRGALAIDPWLPILQAMNMLLGLVVRENDPALPVTPLLERQVPAIDALLGTAPTLIGSLVDEQALTSHVNRLASDHPHLAESLQRALGIRFATENAGRFDQLARLLANYATATPVVLVLEDLHWANESVIAMLLHLHRQLRDRTGVDLLVVGSYRPSDLLPPDPDTRHPLLPAIHEFGRLAGDVVIDLDASVGSDRGEAFIKGLTHSLNVNGAGKDSLARFLFERTEGHPLFAVELVRWLRDTGKLDAAAGVTPVSLTSLRDAAPARVQAVIAERLDRLPPGFREVLEGAAIQGPKATIDLIPNTSDLIGDQVAETIEEEIAPRFRLLVPADPITIAGRRLHRYRFRHVLFQQYLYDSLTPSRRERLHVRTAEKMIALLGDDPHAGSGEIAFHFAEAQRADEAATHAYHAGAYALRQLNYDVAAYWFRESEQHAIAVDDDRRALAARNGLVSALRGRGEIDAAIDLTRQVLADNRKYGFRELEAEAADLLGQLHYDRGRCRDAIAYLETAATIHRELGQFAEASGSESMLSHSLYRLGAYDDALRHARTSWENAHAQGHTAFEAEALLAAGNCEVDLGMYESAIETYKEARRTYTRSHEVRGEVLCDLNTGLCLIQLRQWDAAIALLRTTRRLTTTLRAARLQGFACHYLGLACMGGGDYDAAEAAFKEALQIRERLGQSGISFDTFAALLRLAVIRGGHSEIRKHLHNLLGWLEAHKGEGIEDPISAWLAMADAYRALGSPEEEENALKEGHAKVMKRASQIADPDARYSYLSAVPANRELIARFRRIGQGDTCGRPPGTNAKTPRA